MANLVEYVKTVWENGKTALNAARMNNMEKGISDCATQINKLGDSVSRLCVNDDLRELDGNDFNNIGNCFRAVFQRSSWTEKQNGPVGMGTYGFLISTSGGDSELQIFIDNIGNIASRVRFSGNATWPSWKILNAHS